MLTSHAVESDAFPQRKNFKILQRQTNKTKFLYKYGIFYSKRHQKTMEEIEKKKAFSPS